MKLHDAGANVLVERRGLLATSESPEQPAVVSGLLSGSAIAVAMLVASILTGAVSAGITPMMALLLSIVVAGIAGGLLQQVWFNSKVLRIEWSYPARVAAFGLSYFVVLAACAWVGEWLPREASTWAVFVATYLAVLAVLTAFFSHIYRRQASEYAKGLSDWRARRGENAGR